MKLVIECSRCRDKESLVYSPYSAQQQAFPVPLHLPKGWRTWVVASDEIQLCDTCAAGLEEALTVATTIFLQTVPT